MKPTADQAAACPVHSLDARRPTRLIVEVEVDEEQGHVRLWGRLLGTIERHASLNSDCLWSWTAAEQHGTAESRTAGVREILIVHGIREG